MNTNNQAFSGAGGHEAPRNPHALAAETSLPSNRGDSVESVFASLSYLFDGAQPTPSPAPAGHQNPLEPHDEEDEEDNAPTLIRVAPGRSAASAVAMAPAKKSMPFGLPPLRPRRARTVPPPRARPQSWPPLALTPVSAGTPVSASSVAPSAPRRSPSTPPRAAAEAGQGTPLTLVEITKRRALMLWPSLRRARVIAAAALVASVCLVGRLVFGSMLPADAAPADGARDVIAAAPVAAPDAAPVAFTPCPPPAGSPALVETAKPAPTFAAAIAPRPLSSTLSPVVRKTASRRAQAPLAAPTAASSAPPPARPAPAKIPSGRLFGTED